MPGDSADNSASSGVFEWQLSDAANKDRYRRFRYDPERYWGGFPKMAPDRELGDALPEWALGPFTRHSANPVLAPSPEGWNVGRMGGRSA